MPTLYLIPVPLSDVDPLTVLPAPNLETTRSLRYFIVENVRSARRFLRRCDPAAPIDEMHFTVLDVNTPAADVEAMLAPMAQGHDMGVISEAGCPAVADPGADAVAVAQRKGYTVVPLVGPSSIIMALMASGFNGQQFTFAGYLPIDSAARTAALRDMERLIRTRSQTQIFIETPYRNNRLIDTLVHTLPGHLRLCVASDITGPRQSIITRPLSAWARARYDYSKIPTIFLLYS